MAAASPAEQQSSHRRTIRILVINQYYAPDIAASGQLLAELCQNLAGNGFSVTVITAQPSYVDDIEDAPERETDEFGVQIIRISLGSSRGRSSMTRRLLGYVKFLWKARSIAKSVIRDQKPDVVVTMSNPPLVGLLGALLTRRSDIPYVGIVHDIFPEAITKSGRVTIPPGVSWLWNRISGWVSSRATRLVVLSTQMRGTLVAKGVQAEKVVVISNWARPAIEVRSADLQVRAEFGVADDELLLLYSGNFGIIHNMQIIVEAAKLLADSPVKFVLVGGGEQENHLKSECQKYGIENVSFHPYQSQEKYSALISSADACLVGLKDGMERYSVPSKTYSILSAGIPVITLMNQNASQAAMITEAGAGWNATTSGELASIANEMLETSPDEIREIRRRSRDLYEKNFTLEQIVDRYVDCLSEILD